jgi:Holliday junction DNA helicase RuvA
MIGRLRGTVVEKRPPQLVLDVGGVGYEIEAPLSAFFDLPEGELVLHTHLVVREDAQLLFGFRSRGERDLFRALIRVNGVGPKLALTLLSGIDAAEFVRCVQEGDVTTLTRLPGVGKKTAERLIVEMRDRIVDTFGEHLPAELGAARPVAPVQDAGSRAVEEAEGALIALGYKPTEAAKAVHAAFEDGVATEELIRRALKGMVA